MTRCRRLAAISLVTLAASLAPAVCFWLLSTEQEPAFSGLYFKVVPFGFLMCGYCAAWGWERAMIHFDVVPTRTDLWRLAAMVIPTQVAIWWLAGGFDAAGKSDWTFGAWEAVLSDLQAVPAALATAQRWFDVPLPKPLLITVQCVLWLLPAIGKARVATFAPLCEPCGHYLRFLWTKQDDLPDRQCLDNYYHGLTRHRPGSRGFVRHIGSARYDANIHKSGFRLFTSLRGCPACGRQEILQMVWADVGRRDLKLLESLTRIIEIPRCVDLTRLWPRGRFLTSKHLPKPVYPAWPLF